MLQAKSYEFEGMRIGMRWQWHSLSWNFACTMHREIKRSLYFKCYVGFVLIMPALGQDDWKLRKRSETSHHEDIGQRERKIKGILKMPQVRSENSRLSFGLYTTLYLPAVLPLSLSAAAMVPSFSNRIISRIASFTTNSVSPSTNMYNLGASFGPGSLPVG